MIIIMLIPFKELCYLYNLKITNLSLLVSIKQENLSEKTTLIIKPLSGGGLPSDVLGTYQNKNFKHYLSVDSIDQSVYPPEVTSIFSTEISYDSVFKLLNYQYIPELKDAQKAYSDIFTYQISLESIYSGFMSAFLLSVASIRTYNGLFEQSKRLSKTIGIPFEVDHINPISLGGIHAPSNLQVIPRSINRKKHNKKIFVWAEKNS